MTAPIYLFIPPSTRRESSAPRVPGSPRRFPAVAARRDRYCDVATGALALLEDQPGAMAISSDREPVNAHGSGAPWGEANRRRSDGEWRQILQIIAVERRGGGHRPAPFELKRVHDMTLAPDWRFGSNAKRSNEMATPEPLDSQLEGELVEHYGLWRRAQSPASPGGRTVTEQEAAVIRKHLLEELSPAVTDATTTLRVINSASRGERGIHSYRFQRTCKELWRRPSNVIEFPAVEDGGEAA